MAHDFLNLRLYFVDTDWWHSNAPKSVHTGISYEIADSAIDSLVNYFSKTYSGWDFPSYSDPGQSGNAQFSDMRNSRFIESVISLSLYTGNMPVVNIFSKPTLFETIFGISGISSNKFGTAKVFFRLVSVARKLTIGDLIFIVSMLSLRAINASQWLRTTQFKTTDSNNHFLILQANIVLMTFFTVNSMNECCVREINQISNFDQNLSADPVSVMSCNLNYTVGFLYFGRCWKLFFEALRRASVAKQWYLESRFLEFLDFRIKNFSNFSS